MENDKGTPKLSSGILDLQSIHLVNNLNQRKAYVNKDQVLWSLWGKIKDQA